MAGYAFCLEAINQSWEVIGIGREDRHRIPGVRFIQVDLTDDDAVTALVEANAPDLVVHLAANTDLNDCERHPESTRRLHVHASEHLAKLTFSAKARFLHISTEAVYGNPGPGVPARDRSVPAERGLCGDQERSRGNGFAGAFRGRGPEGHTGRICAKWKRAESGRVASTTVREGNRDKWFYRRSFHTHIELLTGRVGHEFRTGRSPRHFQLGHWRGAFQIRIC